MRAEKLQMAEDIGKLLDGSGFAYFVTYKGMKVKEISAFRDSLSRHSAECHVLKNRLVKKVAGLKGMDSLASYKLIGDTAVVIGSGDPGAVAKVIDDFDKSTKGLLVPKCGYFEGAMLSSDDIKAIAALPSKDALRAQLLGLLVAVPTGLVSVLNAKAASILNVLNAYKNKLEEKAS